MSELIPEKDLELIVLLANRQVAYEKEVADLEEELKNKKAALFEVCGGHGIDGQLPLAMAAAGVDSIKLKDGFSVTISEELKPPSMAVDAPLREKMLAFLDETGHADIIKDTITIFLNKEDHVHVKAVTELISALKLQFERFRTTHWMTLRKLLGEMLENGENIPMADLDVQKFKKSKVK